jgi:hypothetical protein
MITTEDCIFLRRAIGIAAEAITAGDDPCGSLLAGPLGQILIEAHNTVRRDNDITSHPELKLARWAARTRPRHRRPDHHVHQLPALRHVQWCDRPFRARPRRLCPVNRAVGSAQSGFCMAGRAKRGACTVR